MIKYTYLLLMMALLVLGCKNEDDKPDEQKTDDLFFDYSIVAEESREMVSCLFRFREKGLTGEPVLLSESVILTFDGQEVEPDSARMAGTFYELMLPLAHFTGEHTIVFRAPSGREYTETFYFEPFALSSELPATVSRNNFSIGLNGLPESEVLSLILTDTAFMSNDLNVLDTVQNKSLSLRPNQLNEVVNGPVVLQLVRDEVKPLKDAPKQGGRLLISYGLQRELMLVD